MLTTTLDAATKCCPMKSGDICRSDECMAWRWADDLKQVAMLAGDARVEPDRIPPGWTWHPEDDFTGEPAHWMEPMDACQARRRGYCGLAGEPITDDL